MNRIAVLMIGLSAVVPAAMAQEPIPESSQPPGVEAEPTPPHDQALPGESPPAPRLIKGRAPGLSPAPSGSSSTPPPVNPYGPAAEPETADRPPPPAVATDPGDPFEPSVELSDEPSDEPVNAAEAQLAKGLKQAMDDDVERKLSRGRFKGIAYVVMACVAGVAGLVGLIVSVSRRTGRRMKAP